MRKLLLASLCAVAATGCFNPVTEVECVRNADCGDAGVCLDAHCIGGATGGGSQSDSGLGGGQGGGQGAGGAGGGGEEVDSGIGGGTGGGEPFGGGTGGAPIGGGLVGGGGGPLGGGSPIGGGTPVGGGTAIDAGPVCGCVNGAGQCQVGNSPLACGANAGMCALCGFGEQCVNGACVMAACGAMSCAGCCTGNFCLVPAQQNRFTCGSNGATCAACPMNQGCSNGVCSSAPSCDSTTCPTGCCENGQCRNGTNNMACGIGGLACQRCTGNTSCSNNVCLPTGGQTDGGAPVAAGSACTGDAQCRPPASGRCISESIAGVATGYPGGYCTSTCGTAGAGCGAGSVCITESTFGMNQSTCRSTCTVPGTQSTCRTGYVCQPSPVSSGGPGFCRARCDNGGVLAGCPQGQTCSMTTGQCG